MSEDTIIIHEGDTSEKIMERLDYIFKWMKEDIRESLQFKDLKEFDKIIVRIDKKKFVDPEVIKEIIRKEDKRWPITIMDANNNKGYRIAKNWIDELHVNWHPIIDHPRRLGEIFIDAGLEDRVLISQPYPYSEDDRKELIEFCDKNHLKFIERDYSPYYPGCSLIIIFEEDVEEHLMKALNIDKLNHRR